MDQETALKILKTGQNIYLTGSAGTGKTFLINQYIEYLRVREVPLAVTASTGIAATHIGGQTIHSWSGLGIREHITSKDLLSINKNKQTVKRLQAVQVLIIDEISMLSGRVLTAVSDILKHFKNNREAFGGVQLILSGDFFQLPPVSREPLSNRDKFAFMAPIWVESKLGICYLTHQFRQKQDTLAFLLNEIRRQDVSDDSLDRIREKLEENNTNDDAVKLFTHNADVDSLNSKKLAEIINPAHTYYASTDGKSQLIDNLKQTVLAAPIIELKESSQVMFVKNNVEKGYFNGTTGEVIGFDDEGFPQVQLADDRIFNVRPEEWTVTDEHETILASYKQIPLRLAWAITIHKSQGMTLDTAEVDLSKTFEAGQGYVALSRLRSWNGLFLKGINQTSLLLDPLAVKADKRFQELSEESEDWINTFDSDSLRSNCMDFIDFCGGTNDPEIIDSNRSRQPKYAKKAKKESTYELTKHQILKGKSLGEIAFDRDMSLGTIISHLEKLKSDKTIDLSLYKPDEKVIKAVSKVISKIKDQHKEEYYDKNGNVRIGYIYGALNGKYDYDDIRLSRLFID